MKKLVVVADDFGLCQSVNEGILYAYNNGILTELSLMLGSPGTDDALRIIKENNIKDVGLHCLLTFWKDNGATTNREGYIKLFEEKTEDEIATLFNNEVKLFEEAVGSKPSHITSQYSIHGHPKLTMVVLKWCKENHIPVRIPRPPLFFGNESIRGDVTPIVKEVRESGCKTTDSISGYMLGSYSDIESLIIKDIKNIKEESSMEILLHPGYESDQLSSLTSMKSERQRDVDLSKSENIKQALIACNVSLVKFKDIE